MSKATKGGTPAVRVRRRPKPSRELNVRHRSRAKVAPVPKVRRHAVDFDPAVEFRDVTNLKPYSRNARTHTEKQVHQIAASIEEFGFTNPVLVDGHGGIIAGHGRVEAAKRLGLKTVPTIRLDHLNEEQLRAYVIADNRLAEIAGWDREMLAIELQYLSAIDVDFDVEIVGFETAEIDLMIEGFETAETGEADHVPEPEDDQPAVTRIGDLWLLGRHRLLCADALDKASYQRLMAGESARMVFTDPPYNVRVDGHVCGLGKIKHREFAMASGEMSEAQYVAFLQAALAGLAEACVDGALLYVFIDWRHVYELLSAARKVGLDLFNLVVWNKTNGGMGSFYRSKHELVCVFKKGRAPHINNIELGSHGRYRTNVWSHPGVNTLGKSRLDELAMHPTVKPVALVADAVKDCTRRGDIVLDGFAGSGTILMAAEKTGRIGYGVELDARYVDTAVRRWERHTGKKAIHAETSLTMEELAEARGVSAASQSDGSADAGAGAGEAVDNDK